jgi:CBS domain-containing protein
MRPARELILEEIIPAAARGLESSGIDSDDIDRYLSVIEERTNTGRTGAAWILDSMAEADDSEKTNQLLARVTAGIAERQLHNAPGHTWDLLDSAEFTGDQRHVKRVEQIMTTDLFTVHKDDVIDLVTNLMDWKHLRHIPVEDDDRNLVGLVTYRDLIRHLKRIGGQTAAEVDAASVSSIMKCDLVTVGSNTSTVDAFETMIQESVSCLPVVDGGRLVGIVTDYDFMKIAEPMISRFLEGDQT